MADAPNTIEAHALASTVACLSLSNYRIITLSHYVFGCVILNQLPQPSVMMASMP